VSYRLVVVAILNLGKGDFNGYCVTGACVDGADVVAGACAAVDGVGVGVDVWAVQPINKLNIINKPTRKYAVLFMLSPY
jgi:hypothetical protein